MESCEFFIHFVDQILIWGIIDKYVLPYGWFSFHFNALFFSCGEAFYFDEIPFVYFFFCVLCSRGQTYQWKYHCMEYLRFSCLCSPLGFLWHDDFYLSLLSMFIFVCGVSWWSSFIFFLHVAVQISQYHLLKRCFSSILCFCPPQ